MLAVAAIPFAMQAQRRSAVFTLHGVLLPDPDDDMRLCRVRTLLESGGPRIRWVDEINAPHGADLHWTAPMDWLLAAAALTLGPFSNSADPLAAVAAWTPVALGAAYLAILVICLSRRAGIGTPPAVLAAVTAALLPSFDRVFKLGHADHHALLELLYLSAIMACIPAWSRDRDSAGQVSRVAAIVSGVATGLAIWIATHAMMLWLAILAGWVYGAWTAPPAVQKATIQRAAIWKIAVLCTVAAGYFVEAWPHLADRAADRISMLHVAVACAALAVPMRRPRMSIAEVARAFAPALLFLGGLAIWIVADRGAVFAHVSSREFFRWSSRVAELQPLVAIVPGDFSIRPMIDTLGYAPLALPVFVYFFVKERRIAAGARLTLALMAVAMTLLAVLQVRWLDHVTVGLAPVLAIGAWQFAIAITRAAKMNPATFSAPIAVALTAVVAFPAISATFRGLDGRPDPQTLRTAVIADEINRREAQRESPDDAPRAILASDDDGPMLLYRTGLPVVATPYHRAIDGLVAVSRFFAERDPSAARDQLDALGVRYVAVPYRPHEQLLSFEIIAFGELRSFDPPTLSIDERGGLREELSYKQSMTETMAYRLAIAGGAGLDGIEQIAAIREGAATLDGRSGLLYVVHRGPP